MSKLSVKLIIKQKLGRPAKTQELSTQKKTKLVIFISVSSIMILLWFLANSPSLDFLIFFFLIPPSFGFFS